MKIAMTLCTYWNLRQEMIGSHWRPKPMKQVEGTWVTEAKWNILELYQTWKERLSRKVVCVGCIDG